MSLQAAIAAGNAGASIGTNIWNQRQQKKQNELDRAWQDELYRRDRANALSDWNRTNEYNHPMQQMQRLREAGLSPHLVYGKGAANTATMVKASSGNSANQVAPKLDPMMMQNAFMGIYDMNLKQAQSDNVLSLTQLNKAKTIRELTGGKHDELNYNVANEIRDEIVQQAKWKTAQAEVDYKFKLSEDERRDLLNDAKIEETTQRILHDKLKMANTEAQKKQLEEAIKLAQQKGRIQKLSEKLAKEGMTTNDPMWLRAIITQLLKFQ